MTSACWICAWKCQTNQAEWARCRFQCEEFPRAEQNWGTSHLKAVLVLVSSVKCLDAQHQERGIAQRQPQRGAQHVGAAITVATVPVIAAATADTLLRPMPRQAAVEVGPAEAPSLAGREPFRP